MRKLTLAVTAAATAATGAFAAPAFAAIPPFGALPPAFAVFPAFAAASPPRAVLSGSPARNGGASTSFTPA